jgi:hypothetical protein
MADFHRTLEMSIGRDEFLRLLPGVVRAFEIDGGTVRWSDGDRRCRIRLVPLPSRRVGSVAVPRHLVEVSLQAWSDEEGEAFMSRFLRAFLRGGG